MGSELEKAVRLVAERLIEARRIEREASAKAEISDTEMALRVNAEIAAILLAEGETK